MKICNGSFLVIYEIVLAIVRWGVVASLEIYPPFFGVAMLAIILVVAYGFMPKPTMKERVENVIN
jgi:hypothetical protein